MSVREFSPLFSWGFGFRRPRFLVPLLSNNVFQAGAEAVGVAGVPHSRAELDELLAPRPVAKPIENLPAMSLEQLAKEFRPDHCVGKELDEPRLVEVSELPPASVMASMSRREEVEPAPRSLAECAAMVLAKDKTLAKLVTNDEVLALVDAKMIQPHNLEKDLDDCVRAVAIRRILTARKLPSATALDMLPQDHFDYQKVLGACCENVIGYIGLPVGVAGPLLIDGREYMVPMATTEGCLVASTHRGCKAITMSGGVSCEVLENGMTRGPVVRFPSVRRAAELQRWVEAPENLQALKAAFSSTTSFGRLTSIKIRVAGRSVFLRFKATTGDAMGMNMISKGTTKCLELIQKNFEDCELISVSGNYCTDKKAAAINWIDGRGKSVTCDATLKKELVESVLKTTVDALVDVNINKNLVGSALAGAVGGFNAHAANIVAAIFLATGQDPAQVVESANCITLMEKTAEGDLYISITMPSIECGTVGGGTILAAQASCLEMLGCKGASRTAPGSNAEQLARVVCSTVMAGELSLISALAAGHLVKSHMELNRGKPAAQ